MNPKTCLVIHARYLDFMVDIIPSFYIIFVNSLFIIGFMFIYY
jgi:hypothetical protein